MNAPLRSAAALAAAAAALLSAAPASAWYFELSNANGDATVEYYFVPEGSATLQAYTLFLDYDAAKLDFGQQWSETPPAPLAGAFFGNLQTPADGRIDNLNGAAISGGATLTTKTLLGTVRFFVAPGGAIDGTPDVAFAPSRRGFLVAVNGALFEGANVPVVLGAGLELPLPACGDGADNDTDGLVDFPSDKGCANASGLLENPQCDDGLDNDGDGARDWDGAGVGPADPQCTTGARNKETPGCGIGFELALVVPFLAAARRRRSRRAVLAVAALLAALLLPFAARAEPGDTPAFHAAAAPGDTPAFRAAAEALPILSLEVQPDSELWIRVQPEHAADARAVMGEVAALYRAHRGGSEPVRVLLFVGARPLASETYGD